MKNEILDIGLDTRGLVSSFPGISDPNFIVTSPCSGNDYLVEPGFPKKSQLVIVMEEDIEPAIILYHLQTLHRDMADIVLAPPKTKYIDDYKFLRKEAGYIDRLGIYMPESMKDIEEFGYEPECLGLTMNPLNFNYDFIKYRETKEGEDKIMLFFGFPDKDTQELPESYKLNFYARYCDGLALNYTESYKERSEFLEALVGRDSVPEVELGRSVKKKGQIKIGTSLKLEEDLVIPCPEPDFLVHPEDIVYGLGQNIEKIPELKKEEDWDDIERTGYTLWKTMKTDYKREELIDYLRYRIISLLGVKYNLGYLTRCAFVLSVKRKRKVIDSYVFYVTQEKELRICNLKNTVKTA